MTYRLSRIFALIPNCIVFADIGCDHGYISEAMLKENKCKKVIISDVSKGSLQKAINLLHPYKERVSSYVCDGFNGINEKIDVALIAGMGGDEIVKILSQSKDLPIRLILQPMKRSDKVREFLIKNNYQILKDTTFFDGKYYDIISATKGFDRYNKYEILYGRDNLTEYNPDFKNKLYDEIKKLEDRNINIKSNSKDYIKNLEKITEMEDILNGYR